MSALIVCDGGQQGYLFDTIEDAVNDWMRGTVNTAPLVLARTASEGFNKWGAGVNVLIEAPPCFSPNRNNCEDRRRNG